MNITLIIGTKNRPSQLDSCLNAITKAITRDDNVIVVDQSDQSSAVLNRHTCKKYNLKLNLLYLPSRKTGVSMAKNVGVDRATGDILAFTDDDCLVSRNWFSIIRKSFQKYPFISGMVGSTFPHGQPPTPKHSCPCTHRVKKISFISSPRYHPSIGFGNSMAFRKNSLNHQGLFKTWLGTGSIGCSGEDAEMLLSHLVNHKTILNHPAMVVYHNRWVTTREMQKLQHYYNCGEMACYGYYAIQGYQFAKKIVWHNLKDSLIKTMRLAKRFLIFDWNKKLIHEIYLNLFEILYRLRGLSLGCFYALTHI